MKRFGSDLFDAARPPRRIDRIVDRLMLAATLLIVGGLIGTAFFGNP